MKVTMSFTLDTDRNRDLLQWLHSHGQRDRSRAIREAIRDHLRRSEITLADVYAAVQDLKHSGIVIAANQEPADEPEDIAASLDQLGR